ncbi:MAG TPA: hypothetical protein DCS63_10060 [Elusimicrobia bacterium]|nr:hypothetical protein [Elusimicrobiota bacterium]
MPIKPRSSFSIFGVTKLRDKLIILLSVFVGISLLGLLVSVRVTFSLKGVSSSVGAAGRQSVLAQRMVSLAFMTSHNHGHSDTEALKTLAEFEGTLSALRNGGKAAGAQLPPSPRKIRPYLKNIEAQWLVFKADYKWLIENHNKRGSAAFKLRLESLEAGSIPLLSAAQETESRLRAHATGLINTALKLMLGLTAAVIAIFIMAFRAMRGGLLGPLEELTAASEKIAGGDFSTTLTYNENDELGDMQRSFTRMCGTVTKDRNARKVTADILALAIQNDTLDAFLENALSAILSVPWFMIQPKGAIFLADNSSKTLIMRTQRGLHVSLLKTCAAVPFGRCLCGRAAENGTVVFAQDVDERHENSYDDIKPHGHYCVPMRSGDALIGVLTLYLEAGHTNDPDEIDQIKSVAALLAQTIEKKRAHGELRKMAEIIQQASEAVFITGTDGKITYANRAFEKVTGFTMQETLGKTPNLIKSGEHPPEYYAEMWTSMQKGIPWTGRIINKRKDGVFYTVQANIFPIKNSAGEPTAYVTIQEDVSALTDVEEQLRQSQKMEAVGRLAGGVAHDFNNILMAIDGYAKFIAPALNGNAQAEEDLAEIGKAVTRAASLTRQLLAFSRKQKAAFQPLDLGAAALASEKMLKRLVGEGLRLDISAAADVKPVKADPGQIDQTLMNLVVNANDAMPQGGRIEIKIRSHKLTRPVSTPLGTMSPGEYSIMSVHDTGTGMNKETISRIFDPFFTTKPKGKGTGLGLSIVYGIIKHHGAYMTVESQPGKGSTFTAYFPVLTEAIPEPAHVSKKMEASIPPGITVFLAEDDPTVMAAVTRNLSNLGVNVKSFSEPDKMIEFAANYTGDIDLLITDIVMPGMDGFALAERIAKKRPGTAVIYMSGYTDPDVFKGHLEEPGIIFLQKPFPPERLAEAVAQALASRPAL